MTYNCAWCGKLYSEKEDACSNPQCPEKGIPFIISRLPKANEEIGIGFLLMDCSKSMSESVAGENRISKYEKDDAGNPVLLSKAEDVTDLVARAILGLKRIRFSKEAFICAIKFADRQNVLFFKSVFQLASEYPTERELAKYLYNESKGGVGGQTNLTGALLVAHKIADRAYKHKLYGLSGAGVRWHTSIPTFDKREVDIPNLRVMIYSDGEHNIGELKNPFEIELARDINPIIGAFIGQAEDAGLDSLNTVVGICPIHNEKQLLVFDNPEKRNSLQQLFHMASSASGFCPKCMTRKINL